MTLNVERNMKLKTDFQRLQTQLNVYFSYDECIRESMKNILKTEKKKEIYNLTIDCQREISLKNILFI